MNSLKFLVAITKREYSEDYLEFFHKHDVKNVISVLCNGTASQNTLNLLGLEKTEKVMFMTVINADTVQDIIKGMLIELDIASAGNGIATFIPIDSVGGINSVNHFVDYNSINLKEKTNMNPNESKSVMIIIIANKGNSDVVMDAAREAGAGGGTVVRAKGTGAELAKFFGVSISEEKEMIYIVAKREVRDNIMKAILEKAGPNTDAHAVLFSLPIDNVVGLKAFENVE